MSKSGARMSMDAAKKLALRLAESGNTELLRQIEALQGRNACVSVPVGASESLKGIGIAKAPGKRRKEMNRTEAEFGLLLEAEKRRGGIVDFSYESTTLRWGTIDPIAYTPDFTVIVTQAKDGFNEFSTTRIRYVEAKGAHIFAKDMQKFKQARNEFPMFEFQMWQKTKEYGWQRKL